jgi:serine/threonine protein kinase
MRGLADYRVLSRIGGGGQGSTLHAFDTRLVRHVCIKLYRLDSRAQRHAAEGEARALARVQGDSVCEIFDVVASHRDLALVTQFIHGCDLAELLAAVGPVSVPQAIAIATDLARGLACLRQAQVVHGDLKAENVMIRIDGSAVLTDFGSASLEGDDYQSLSPQALSPEQLDGEAATLQSDIFALGLLLHQMLTGQHPFYIEGGLRSDLTRRGLQRDLCIAGIDPEIVGALNALLKSMLAADPADRPSGTQELRESLSAIQLALPLPDSLSDVVSSTMASREQEQHRPVLPVRLKKLPWYEQLLRLTRNLWSAGSPTERNTALILLFTPLVITMMALFARGPCIEVSSTHYQMGPVVDVDIPAANLLREWVTQHVKSSRPNAIVLGRGAASDNVSTLTIKGRRDSCIASEFVDSDLSCSLGQCSLTVRHRSEDSTRFAQHLFGIRSSLDDINADVRQLVAEVLR